MSDSNFFKGLNCKCTYTSFDPNVKYGEFALI
jgi:hypothetical protein